MYEHITRHQIKITHLNSSLTNNDNEKTKFTVEYSFQIGKYKEDIFLRFWQIAKSTYKYRRVFSLPHLLSLSSR